MCNSGSGIIAGEAADRKAAFIPDCQNWQCEECAQRKARQLRGKIYRKGCNRGFDLTIRHLPHRTLEEETELLKECWRKFRIWWEKQPRGCKIECGTFWEVKGERHVHIHAVALCGYVPQKILSMFFYKEIKSPRQWVKSLVTQKHRLSYAAKYVTKDLTKLPHTHRYSFTHGFDDKSEPIKRDPFFEDMTWGFQETALPDFAHYWLSRGWRPDLDMLRGRCLVRPP